MKELNRIEGEGSSIKKEKKTQGLRNYVVVRSSLNEYICESILDYTHSQQSRVKKLNGNVASSSPIMQTSNDFIVIPHHDKP